MLYGYVELDEIFRLTPRLLEMDRFLYSKSIEFCIFIFLARVNDPRKTSFHAPIIAIYSMIMI